MIPRTNNGVAVKCHNLRKTWERQAAVQALRQVDLEVRTGELLMLVGPSGCGKTTLISIIAGILDQSEGDCLVFDQDFKSMRVQDKTRYRGQNIGFVFQAYNLIPALTAAENVAVPLLLHGTKRGPATGRAREVLKEVNLMTVDGQQQRNCLGPTAASPSPGRWSLPKLIVCDEPTSARSR
jgi:putative ABC transport system ATP-binding protein